MRLELRDRDQIALSEDALAVSAPRYQLMVAALHQDATTGAAAYRNLDALILTTEGLEPEQGSS